MATSFFGLPLNKKIARNEKHSPRYDNKMMNAASAAVHDTLCEIKHDFLAEEPTELSVSEGEVVRASAAALNSADPWTLVETDAPPFNRGFVPTSYLKPIDRLPAAAPRNPGKTSSTTTTVKNITPPRQQDPSVIEEYVDVRVGGPVRRLSDPRLSHHLLESLSINPPEEHLPSPPRESRVALRSSHEFAHLFAQHDRQFQHVMHMRHEQFRSLEDASSDLTNRLEAARNKSIEIVNSMTEINAILETERKRWKERLVEETSSIYL